MYGLCKYKAMLMDPMKLTRRHKEENPRGQENPEKASSMRSSNTSSVFNNEKAEEDT